MKTSKGISTFKCFELDENIGECSPEPCFSKINDIVDENASNQSLQVKIWTEQSSLDSGAIWEIRFSQYNDSSRLEGLFFADAKERLRDLIDIPDFNTQLSFVSIVGGRGVGKSTLASLLSGNSSMFTVKSFHTRSALLDKLIYVVFVLGCIRTINSEYNRWSTP